MQKILSILRHGLLQLFLLLGKLGRLTIGLVPPQYKVIAGFVTAAVIFTIVSIVIINAAWALTSGESTFTVEGRDRVAVGGGSAYEIYTSAGIYTNQDSYIRMKFGSADLQNTLRPGKTFTCTTQGFRFRALRLMPNLIECRDVEAALGVDGEIY